MSDWRIRLSATEMMIAGYCGCGRNVQATIGEWRRPSGIATDTFSNNIEGVGGEMSVCKRLNIYWHPVIGKTDADDAGPFQVRCNCSRRHDDLCLRPKDKPNADRIFISVLSFWPWFEMIGWIVGRDGMQDQWFREGTPGYPKCWYVPRSALIPMDELPSPYEYLATQEVGAARLGAGF